MDPEVAAERTACRPLADRPGAAGVMAPGMVAHERLQLCVGLRRSTRDLFLGERSRPQQRFVQSPDEVDRRGQRADTDLSRSRVP
jgi:hypothetical protein